MPRPMTDGPTQIRPYQEWAERVLNGEMLSREEALGILQTPDEDVLDLLAASFRVRRAHFGREVQLYYLKNAKSGFCPEDCGYCSQGKDATSDIDRYVMLERDPTARGGETGGGIERPHVLHRRQRPRPHQPRSRARGRMSSQKAKAEHGLAHLLLSGLLTPDQALKLKAAGVDRINHNLNTSRRFYPEICTTHTYDDRLETLRVASDAGMELCSGLIVGMGETDEDIVDVALELRDAERPIHPGELPDLHRRHAAWKTCTSSIRGTA